MDNKNNKLEEFFNQSMNRFDDSPSDGVWEGLQTRLDNEMTVWEKLSAKLRKYFPYLVLLLGLTSYHFFAQNKISSINKQLDYVTTENSTLGLQLKECGTKTSELLTNIQTQSKQLQTSKSQLDALEGNLIVANQQNIKLEKLAYQKPHTHFNNFSEIKDTPFSTTLMTPNLKSNNPAQSNTTKTITSSTNTFSDKVTIQSKSPTTSTDILENNKYLNKLIPLPTNRIHKIYSHFGTFYSSALRPVIPFQKQEVKVKSKFRYGYQYKAFHTITNTSNQFHFGDTHGFRIEWVFKNDFALTGNINFNDQKYKVTNSNNTIPAQELIKYPQSTSNGLEVNEIQVKYHYLEFPLGIKFPVKRWKNNFDLYINPAIVWQFQLPQKFEYTSDNEAFGWVNKQYFGYLGTANFTMGIEKAIHQNMVWQFGVFGEKSLVKFGVENQDFTTVGISTSILFQK